MGEKPEAVDTAADVILSTSVYSLDAIKKAAYRLINRMTATIRLEGDTVICHLQPKGADEGQTGLRQAFLDEVLDQDLRESVSKETEAIRNAVLAYAFSRTGLQGE